MIRLQKELISGGSNPSLSAQLRHRSSNLLSHTQYMAGHRYVSSTERYQLNNIDDLKNEVQQHHPMK